MKSQRLFTQRQKKKKNDHVEKQMIKLVNVALGKAFEI